MELKISQLIEYAVRKKWIEETDRIWVANRILETLGLNNFDGFRKIEKLPPVQEILNGLCDFAYERGLIDGNSVAYYDLFDTKLIGLLMPRPSEVIHKFMTLYKKSAKDATDWYYTFSKDTNYIRSDRIKKDQKWTVDTEYGKLDITINLSKPEKDPKAIAAAGKQKSSGYPKCLLCAENEGYAGYLGYPARQNHRIIPITLNNTPFFLQYSPYVYYNEHCIVLNKNHVPMHIDRSAFENLLDFVTLFPHYFIGSNADLPIVGGSVLSHDHYQGGRYEFAMTKAQIECEIQIPEYSDIKAGIVKWPMSVIRLNGTDKTRVAKVAEHILDKWRTYTDEEAFIICKSDGEQHSTITPIARRRANEYELDLVLRNNITTQENPLGVFHPHADKHHIKKENIGLIEVMGLAVLPSRLKDELKAVETAIIENKDLTKDLKTNSHALWANEVCKKHPELNPENVTQILQEEVGQVFDKVLEDAGVFKRTPKGQQAFEKFIKTL